jgi:hypothetical protein
VQDFWIALLRSQPEYFLSTKYKNRKKPHIRIFGFQKIRFRVSLFQFLVSRVFTTKRAKLL